MKFEDDKKNILEILENGFDFIKYNDAPENEGLIEQVVDSLDLTNKNLPVEINKKYGVWEAGMWGTFYSIDIKFEKDIVSDLENMGYTCIKRELDFEG